MKALKAFTAVTLAFLIAFSLLPVTAFADDPSSFSSEEELVAYLSNHRKGDDGTLDVTCSSSLFQKLKANDYFQLYRLMYKAGINADRVWIRSDDQNFSFHLTSLSELGSPVIEAFTTIDLELSFRTLAEKHTDSFLLLCSPILYKSLEIEKDFLPYLFAKYGIDYYFASRIDALMLYKISGLRYIDDEYAYVEDYAQFAAAVDHFAQEQLDEFYIACPRKFYEKVTNDDAEWKIMVGSSKLSSYFCMQRPGLIDFSGVEYTDTARAVCRNTEDLAGILAQMGSAGIQEFEVIFPYKETYNELYADQFALLHQIEAEAGMTSGDLYYGSYTISYKNASFVSAADATRLSSLSEAISFTEKAVADGKSEIHLFCTEELYRDLLGDSADRFVFIPDGLTRIYDLLSQAGIFDYEIELSSATHMISIRVNALFPGKSIMLAETSGDLSSLSEREKQTFETARRIADEARSDVPIQTAKYIHDWLCDRVVYTIDETTDEDDTAVGAILNGEANCSGYTDAFYLIGSLAGLNIRYQHGDSFEKGIMVSVFPITHIWNLLEIDGKWHMVDVTWDDAEDNPTYIWFNVGQDVASLVHTWNEDMSVPLAETTERVFTAGNEFYASDSEQLQQALNNVREKRLSEFLIITSGFSSDEVNTAVREALDGISYRYSWNERMSMFTATDLEWK